ncbi:MAG TPA: hypothetical protein VF648_19115 [Pyrinomonadaceae bacterium]
MRKVNLFFRRFFPVYIVFAAIGGTAEFFARKTNSIKRSEVSLLEKKTKLNRANAFRAVSFFDSSAASNKVFARF